MDSNMNGWTRDSIHLLITFCCGKLCKEFPYAQFSSFLLSSCLKRCRRSLFTSIWNLLFPPAHWWNFLYPDSGCETGVKWSSWLETSFLFAGVLNTWTRAKPVLWIKLTLYSIGFYVSIISKYLWFKCYFS